MDDPCTTDANLHHARAIVADFGATYSDAVLAVTLLQLAAVPAGDAGRELRLLAGRAPERGLTILERVTEVLRAQGFYLEPLEGAAWLLKRPGEQQPLTLRMKRPDRGRACVRQEATPAEGADIFGAIRSMMTDLRAEGGEAVWVSIGRRDYGALLAECPHLANVDGEITRVLGLPLRVGETDDSLHVVARGERDIW